MGVALSLMIIGVGGCGTKSATSSTTAASAQQSTQSSSSTSATSQSTTTNETTQGQTSQKPTLNPAVQAAMEIRRLQSNQEMVLTSDQKTKIKPILQTLIATTNPSEDFLKQKADAIKAVFTEQQKSYLSTQTQKGDSKTKPNGNSGGNTQNGQEQPKDHADANNKSAPSFQPQDIYKQVLNSLT